MGIKQMHLGKISIVPLKKIPSRSAAVPLSAAGCVFAPHLRLAVRASPCWGQVEISAFYQPTDPQSWGTRVKKPPRVFYLHYAELSGRHRDNRIGCVIPTRRRIVDLPQSQTAFGRWCAVLLCEIVGPNYVAVSDVSWLSFSLRLDCVFSSSCRHKWRDAQRTFGKRGRLSEEECWK